MKNMPSAYNYHGHKKVLKVELLNNGEASDANWGENTTCVTGNTSEHSYNADEYKSGFRVGFHGKNLGKLDRRMRCARITWLIIASIVSVLGFITPILMVILPKTLGTFSPTSTGGSNGAASKNHTSYVCNTECEGRLLNFGFKLIILLIGMYALFFRRSLADMPRLFVARAGLLALVFITTFAYSLFYAVRILANRDPNYLGIVGFADSLLNCQLWIHYIATVLLELRHLRPEYKIRVVRSPDGESRSYSLGHLSIQRAAVSILQNYYQDFPVFNPFLMKLPGGTSRMRIKGGGGGGSQVGGSNSNGGQPGFKLYNLDGPNGGSCSGPDNGTPQLPEVNAQALMIAAARKRDSGHNERFYEEIDWERRVRKRKARLITAAEEAFVHIKRLQEEKGPCVPMDPQEAAQTIFPTFARNLQKYLRVTRQQPRHTAEQVVRHLAEYLSFDMSPRSFLERFFSFQETFEASQLETKWSIVTDEFTSRDISHGTTFCLRCHCPGPDAGVQLLCTVTRLPFFNLTEEVFDNKNNRFVLRLNSETSV